MLLSEMFGVERGEKFMVDGMCGEYRVGLFCEKYEKLLTIDSFGDWIPAKDGLLCVVIDRCPSNIIHLPPPLTDEQREQLKAIDALSNPWARTADRLPDKCDETKYLIASQRICGEWHTLQVTGLYIKKYPTCCPWWMPIPTLPEAEE